VDKIDFKPTYTNGITSGTWAIVRIPITLENDRECLRVALEKHAPGIARVVRIKNTLELEELYVSENFADEVRHRDPELVSGLEIISGPEEVRFDRNGNIP
jgi:hypothetical protein